MTTATPLDPATFGPDQPCFGCSPEHPAGFRLRFEREADCVVTRFTPDERYQGPPRVMHGGLVMTLADEIAAWTVIGLVGRFGFTASIDARLQRPVRIGLEVTGRGQVTSETTRIVKVRVKLVQEEAQVFQGDLAFVLLDAAAAEKLMGGPLPEAWKRFARPGAVV